MPAALIFDEAAEDMDADTRFIRSSSDCSDIPPQTSLVVGQRANDNYGLILHEHEYSANEDEDIIDILSVMQRFPFDEQTQATACEGLWIQSWDDDNSLAIGRAGGIRMILQAMQQFPDNSHLQQCGCETLQNLATSDYNCQKICELGGVCILVQAMVNNLDIPSLQLCGCIAMASLASSSKDCHSFIFEAGALDAIVCAMTRHCKQQWLAIGACQALEALDYGLTGHNYSG